MLEVWLPGQNGSEPKNTIAVASPSGAIKTVYTPEFGSQHEVIASDSRPLVMIVEHPRRRVLPPQPTGAPPVDFQANPETAEKPTVRIFGTDGVVSDPIALPAARSFPMWSSDGKLYAAEIKRVPNQKPVYNWFTVDIVAKSVIPSGPPPEGELTYGPKEPDIKVQNLSPKVAITKVGIPAPTVVLSGKESKENELLVVGTDASMGDLSPALTGIAFQTQGSLMVRPMLKTTLAAYLKAKTDALKAALISQAKQIALAAVMYATDYDDNFLAAGPDWKSKLDPYVKNMTLMDGFVYTFPGGNASQIQSPADTQLGYIEGPGGRAVAYVDGHVKWIPNP